MSRLISFAVLIAIIIIIGLLFYKVLIGFFIPVFLACVLVVVFRPLHQWILEKTGHRDQLAAVLTTLAIVLIMFLPIVVVGTAAATQGRKLVLENDADVLFLRFQRIRDSLGLQLPEYIDQVRLLERETKKIVELSNGALLNKDNEELAELGQRTKESLIELRESVRAQELLENPPPDVEAESQSSDQAGESTQEAEAAAEEVQDRWTAPFNRLIEITDRVGITESEGDGTDQPVVGAEQPAVELRAEFQSLKTELLGGGLLAFAREKANPTKEEREKMIASVVNYTQPRLLSITGATGSFVIKFIFGSVILVVATFFFLYDGPSMIKTVMYLSPLDDAYEQELLLEFDRISRAVVLATLLSAVVQGLTAGLGYAVAGMEYLTLLIMLTTVFAMVPFVGPAVIWIPVCLYIGVYEERVTTAICLAAWGVLVVGTVDNFVKAFVLHGQSQLHPLLALLSVLGGVQALGPVGIVVGPMVVAMLQTLLSILQRELLHFENHQLVVSGDGTSRAATASEGTASRRGKKWRRKLRRQSAQSEVAAESAPEGSDNAEPQES